jgi:hypothetical protein
MLPSALMQPAVPQHSADPFLAGPQLHQQNLHAIKPDAFDKSVGHTSLISTVWTLKHLPCVNERHTNQAAGVLNMCSSSSEQQQGFLTKGSSTWQRLDGAIWFHVTDLSACVPANAGVCRYAATSPGNNTT